MNLGTLTTIEYSVLALWFCSQTAKQTAVYLKKSNRTIEYYRERIKCKLGIYCASELHKLNLPNETFIEILQHGRNLIHSQIKNKIIATRIT